MQSDLIILLFIVAAFGAVLANADNLCSGAFVRMIAIYEYDSMKHTVFYEMISCSHCKALYS